MHPILCATWILPVIGFVLLFVNRKNRTPRAIRGRFAGICCLVMASILAILHLALPDPYQQKLTPAEDQMHLAGAWQLGRDVASSLPAAKTPVIIICGDQDLKPGTNGRSLVDAFQQGAGGARAYPWLIINAASLNAKLNMSRTTDSLIDPEVIRGGAVNELLKQQPESAALVFLHGLPPPEELGDIEALERLYPAPGMPAATDLEITSSVAGLPPIYTLQTAENLGPLLKHGLIASHVYINIHAINSVLDAERTLTMEQAAKELWVSVIKEKATH